MERVYRDCKLDERMKIRFEGLDTNDQEED
jgi:hypothetical protein